MGRLPYHVLLVEDNVFNQQVGVYLLERQGYRVQVASGGVEALNFLQEQDFDLVLMDVQMPGMNGLETTEAIRRNEQGRPAAVAHRGVDSLLVAR